MVAKLPFVALQKIEKMGLSYVSPINLRGLIQWPSVVFDGHWWRLDRSGLGRDGPFVSKVDRCLRMRPERIRKLEFP
jgi:hypothetical protein